MTELAPARPAARARAGEPAATGGVARRRPARALLVAAATALIVLAAVVRVLYLDATPGYHLRHDAYDYDRHAQSIALGRGFSQTVAHGRPTAFRPPGYPYFLGAVYRVAGVERAPVGRRVHAARVANVVVGTALVALLGLLAGLLFGPAAGLVGLALGAVYVPLVTVGGAVMSEPLFTALMLASLCAAVAARRSARPWPLIVATGLLAGLAILCRANALVLLLPLALAVWTGRPRWSWRALAAPAAVVVLALATLVPWTIRNAEVLDAFVPVSTQLGSALAGTYNAQARDDPENPWSWRSIRWVPEYRDLWRQVGTTNEAALERRLRARALGFVREHPASVAEVGFWNTVRLLDLAGFDRARATAATITIRHRWADRGVLCFWAFALLAIAGAATRRARRAPGFVWAVPVLLVLSVVFLTLETPRYRTPDDPFVVLLAALAVLAAAEKALALARRRRRSSPAGSPSGA